MLVGMSGRAQGFSSAFIRAGIVAAVSDVPIFHAPAFCCTTDFDLLRHLQQFYPPFTGLVACKQNEAPVYMPEESTGLPALHSSRCLRAGAAYDTPESPVRPLGTGRA